MAKSIVAAFAAKDNVVVRACLQEAYGATVPEIKAATFSLASSQDDITVIASELCGLVESLDNGDKLTVYLPQTVYRTISTVTYAVNYDKAANGAAAVANLSDRQRSAFPTSYIDALVQLGDMLVSKRGAVRVAPARQVYRLSVMPTTPNAPELKTGDKLKFVPGKVGDKDKSVTEDGNFYVADFKVISEYTYTVTVSARGEITIPRMTRVNGEIVSTVEAFSKYCAGEYTPDSDAASRLINAISLVKVCSNKLPKLATVARDAVATA